MIDYTTHSRFTDPGPMTGWLSEWLDGVGPDVAELRRAASGLVFHYWGNGDITSHGFPAARLAEVDLRYAADMFARLHSLNPAPLGEERAPTERIVGCCRDFTLLFVSMARHVGVPARSRVGFAGYLAPGWYLDHVVAEVWDGERWRLVEPQLTASGVDVLDVPRDRFLVGADAWLACRSGALDADRFVVSPEWTIPGTRGLTQVRHDLVQDLASLNKHEMILWDLWGGLSDAAELSSEEVAAADELAAALREPGVDVRAVFDTDAHRVTPVIRSLDQATRSPVEVVLR
ncbi:transglutaminase superfamily protein [Saccharothrix saharensis]|uniref:Transglutaminase superfamily protein n=1 Tax=Saccharothrix saharensis TaxID=571190 RepID=A0A543J8P3_9PSEU|nr:transglutaminase-like domain-containing protein [Saccharothrix saharensis]TQM79200.1 transglutaminase superfamily protein [Saccharothrix saharensis]